jgi:predicted DCC family thiol-disulfide oxidoreductase YuxK
MAQFPISKFPISRDDLKKMASTSNPLIKPIQPPIPTSWKIKLLYDGECPLCLREVNFLQQRDAGRGLIAFVDIADDRYSPEDNGGIDYGTAMGRIHALLPDGTRLQNLEVFRRIYDTLGIGWIYAVTQLPIIGALADKIYGLWANWRLALTGRADLKTLVKAKEMRLRNLDCQSLHCQNLHSQNLHSQTESQCSLQDARNEPVD